MYGLVKNCVKKFLLSASFLFAIQSVFIVSAMAQDTSIDNLGKLSSSGVRHVNAAEAQQVIQLTPDVVILDVRTPEEYQMGRLENAINIDYYSFSFKKKIKELDRDKIYLLHCQTGIRSGRSIPILLAAGFKNIIHMDGGFRSWQEKRLPIIAK